VTRHVGGLVWKTICNSGGGQRNSVDLKLGFFVRQVRGESRREETNREILRVKDMPVLKRCAKYKAKGGEKATRRVEFTGKI